MHPWVIARARDARDFLDADEIAAWRRQKMPADVVQSILADARPYDEIAVAHNVSYQMIAQIKSRRLYGHVPFDGAVPRGSRSLLSAETVRAVYLDPATAREAAKRHGVSLATVQQIRQGRTHAEVTRGLTSPRATLQALDATYAGERSVLCTRHVVERAAMDDRHAAEQAALDARHTAERAALLDSLGAV